MTTRTTKARSPDARSDAAIKPAAARTPEPSPAIPHAASDAQSDLESRIRLRRVELIARLRELRADARAEASAAGDKLKERLSEVGHILKDDVVDGWASIGDSVKHKLERWLADSER
jgi:hypothetical protein